MNEKKDEVRDMNEPEPLVKPYTPIEGKPKTVKCKHCGEEMPTTLKFCAACGYSLEDDSRRYQPMSEEKTKKIRFIVGAVCVIAFIVVYFFIQS